MSEQVQDQTAALPAPMLTKTLFVAIRRSVASADAERPFIDAGRGNLETGPDRRGRHPADVAAWLRSRRRLPAHHRQTVYPLADAAAYQAVANGQAGRVVLQPQG
jgi:hypothetical protein